MAIENRYNKFIELYMNTELVEFNENFTKFMSQFKKLKAIDMPIVLRIYYVYLFKDLVNRKMPGFDPNKKYFREMINASISEEHKTGQLVNFVVMKLKKGRASTFLEKKKGKQISPLKKLREKMMKEKNRIEKKMKEDPVIKEKRVNPLIKKATKPKTK